jgi:glycolate oxidase
MQKETIDRLTGVVGAKHSSTDPVDLICYSKDSFAVGKGVQPDIVLRPGSVEEISSIMRIAHEKAIPVVPRGAGTCLTGGCVPLKKGIVLDMTRMNRVVELNKENLTVTAEAGMIFAKLNEHLRPYDLFFPPDPASGEVCTLGGMVSENASGMRAVKYGTTSDYLLALKMVLPDGRLLQTGRGVMKTASGYDLVHLFNRSEGTLGVIAEITLRLRPLPKHVATAVASYNSPEAAGNTVSRIIASGTLPSAVELVDRISIEIINETTDLDLPKVEAMLFLEFDGDEICDIEEDLEKFRRVAMEEGCLGIEVATKGEEREAMWAGRRRLYATMVRLKPGPIATDIVVPLSKISSAITRVYQIAEKHDLRISTYGHVGDGNMHSLILADLRIKEEAERAHRAHDDINRMALELGGTITGEHGIGIEKMHLLKEEHSEVGLDMMRRIKRAIDPKGIMNPGKLFEVSE